MILKSKWNVVAYSILLIVLFFVYVMIIQEKLKNSQLNRDPPVKDVKQDMEKTSESRQQGD